MILMGRVREVYPGLVRVSSKSENSLHQVSAALFFCCIICCLQIGVCMYGNILMFIIAYSRLIFTRLLLFLVNRQMEYRIFNLRALSRHIDFEGIKIDTSLIYDETLKTCKLFFSVSNFLVLYIFCVKLVYTGITPFTHHWVIKLIRLIIHSLFTNSLILSLTHPKVMTWRWHSTKH